VRAGEGARRAAGPFLLLLALLSAVGALASESGTFYVSDIKAATSSHIASKERGDGVFPLIDDETGEDLELRFVTIHDPVRVIDEATYFACTDFHVDGAEEQVYDIDFWLRPAGDALEVFRVRVHKEPRRSLLWGWYKHPRYTFVDDAVVPLY
jgi:hypothetical protein